MSMPLADSPRLAGRPREFDLDAALDKAILAFRERGYHAASIADLGKAMELTAGSLYKAFKDKRAIFVAALERYTSLRNAGLRARLTGLATGRERLRAVLDFYVESAHDLEGRRGCLVVGSAVELVTFDADLAELVAQALRRNEVLLIELIRQGQADGSVNPYLGAQQAARTLLCVLLGMRVIGKTGRRHDDMADITDLALKVLD
ncbi:MULTISPECIES: TetR/AcrR family transcriptional regulator [Labrys]|uniref:TetR/AcrR family transcriptional regulator n=1 Tax=Labrys TaxID=204476 RepID=UPI0008361A64|nr:MULTISPECIES: TetR/AcrR family transcriptional regulator [unclassified Labrys (in: a-proteobacteria)]MDZ5450945.1 TetR/AcrR family transcriptional regulator [Labrys sp. ZIDIC5]OCC03379.1 transcriptional regulator [Labrys sp. WJW]